MLSYANITSLADTHLNDKSVNYIPHVTFDDENGLLRIEGESYHEYAVEFFQPIFDWLHNFIAYHSKQKLSLEFKMTYFNTSTSRRFLEMFAILETHHKNGGQVAVKWYYEADDLDMLESGLEYANEVSFDFDIVGC